MEENHIEQAEWTQFFGARQHTAEHMKLQSRILTHIEGCALCRGLYEKGLALRSAAKAYAAAAIPAAADDGAYRAVASQGEARKTKKSGSLSVDIDAGSACFMEDTLETQGCANKYALNMEDEGGYLADDGGEMTLSLADGKVEVLFRDESLRVTGRLLTQEGDRTLSFIQGKAQAELPTDDFCTLELFFSE